MSDFITQRFDVGRRVQFKMHLGSCYLCSDVYHREREFLVFAAQELYQTKYDVPVNSEERICWDDFSELYGECPDEVSTYAGCFGLSPIEYKDVAFLSDFPAAALALVNSENVRSGLLGLPPRLRTVVLLYLMGVRSYERIAEELDVQAAEVSRVLFQSRRALQDLVCHIPD